MSSHLSLLALLASIYGVPFSTSTGISLQIALCRNGYRSVQCFKSAGIPYLWSTHYLHCSTEKCYTRKQPHQYQKRSVPLNRAKKIRFDHTTSARWKTGRSRWNKNKSKSLIREQLQKCNNTSHKKGKQGSTSWVQGKLALMITYLLPKTESQ